MALAAVAGSGLMGQLALLGLQMVHSEDTTNKLKRLARDVAAREQKEVERGGIFEARLNQLAADGESRSRAVIGGIAELKTSYQELQSSLSEALANAAAQARAPEPEPEALVAQAHDMEETESFTPPPSDEQVEDVDDDALGDKIFFALEPIVDIPSSRTAHYRLHLSTEIDGVELASDRLLHFASRAGKRPVLDLIAVREGLQLAKKLRQRDPDLLIFVDIGAETLASAPVLARLAELRAEAEALAQAVVFELPHAALAGLSEKALEGLAGLARSGAHFALSNASVSALDLQAMNMLNVRHVGVSAGTIDADGPSTSLVGFAQVARLSRINVIITGLSNALLMPKLNSVTRLACGPCFAAPRRVKRQSTAAADATAMGLAA